MKRDLPARTGTRTLAQRPPTPRATVELTPVYRGKMVRLKGWANDHISNVIADSHRYYEEALLERIAAAGRRGLYVDAGAHIGNHCAFFLIHCQPEALIAVEPSDTHSLLRENVTAIATVPVVFARAGLHPTWSHCRVERVNEKNTGMDRIVAGTPRDTPCVTLQQAIASCPMPSLPVGVIKIDIESGEAAVLRSAIDTIRRDRPLIVSEAATDPDLQAIADILEPIGYRRDGPHCKTPTWIWH